MDGEGEEGEGDEGEGEDVGEEAEEGLDEDEDEDEEGEDEQHGEEDDDPKQLEAYLDEMDAQEDVHNFRSLEEREAEEAEESNHSPHQPPASKPVKSSAKSFSNPLDDPETLFQTLAYGVDSQNVQRLEKNLVSKKSWGLSGEVRASQRPQDGLLEAEVDFDVGLQSKVVISRELNTKFEEIIRQRIKDVAFDDRELPKPSSLRVREQTAAFNDLDFERDKRGLAGVYEDEYRKDVLGVDPVKSKTDKLREEITQLFRNLCYCIDGMSGAHFTPNSGNLGWATRPESQLVIDEKIPVIVTGNLVDNKKSFREVYAPERSEFRGMGEMGKDEKKAVKRKIKEARHRVSLRIKEENRVKSGMSVKDSKMLERNAGKIGKQIQDSKVTPTTQIKASNFFGKLEGLKGNLKRVKSE